MSTRPPLVSVIMPAWNEEEVISEAIESVLSQDYPQIELLVVDDHSTDSTPRIVSKYAQLDDRVKLLKSPARGVSNARNEGLVRANGQYIAFLDADDRYLPRSIRRRAEALIHHPDRIGVFGFTEIVDENFANLGLELGRELSISFEDMYRCPIHLGALMGVSEVLRGTRFGDYSTGEDWLYISQILRQGHAFIGLDRPVVNYRFRKQSTTQRDYIQCQEGLVPVLQTIYGEDPECTDPADRFRGGLREPPLDVILFKRRLGTLTWALLSGDDEYIREFRETYQSSAHWAHITRSNIMRSIQFSVCRMYQCHRRKWLRVLRSHREALVDRMSRLMDDAETEIFASAMRQALDDRFLMLKLRLHRI